MLTIKVPMGESFDEATNRFVPTEEVELQLEHSLASLSKWEEIWKKPFLGKEPKTSEETISYFRLMLLTPDVPEEVFKSITPDNVNEINKYIEDPHSATTIREVGGRGRGTQEIITAELIYYWMVSYRIPWDVEHWHLNRLITLIRVLNEKNKPAKKMSTRDVANRNRQLNEQRRAQYGTRG